MLMVKPLRHRLRKHHLPAMRSSLLGILLAIIVLAAAMSCPAKGVMLTACGSGFIFLVVLVILLVPRSIRHVWHTIEHLDILYYVLALATAVSILMLMPASEIVRAASAIIAFVLLVAFKRI